MRRVEAEEQQQQLLREEEERGFAIMEIHFEEGSIKQVDGRAVGRVMVCRGDVCFPPIVVSANDAETLAAAAEQMVREALERGAQPDELDELRVESAVEEEESEDAAPVTAGGGSVEHVRDPVRFEALLKHSGLVVVDYSAEWCGPCKMVAPMLATLARDMPHVAFAKVDVDELPLVARTMEVTAMPTFDIFLFGKRATRLVGARIQTVRHYCERFGRAPAFPSEDALAQCVASAPSDSVPLFAIVTFFLTSLIALLELVHVAIPLYMILVSLAVLPSWSVAFATYWLTTTLAAKTPVGALRLPLRKVLGLQS